VIELAVLMPQETQMRTGGFTYPSASAVLMVNPFPAKKKKKKGKKKGRK